MFNIVHLTPVLPNEIIGDVIGEQALSYRFASGGGVYVYELAKAQSKLGHKVKIICPSIKEFSIKENNLTIKGVRGIFSGIFSIIDPLPIFSPFDLKEADIIHGYQYKSYISLLGAIFAKIFNKPYFVSDLGKTGRDLHYYRLVKEFLCISKFSAFQYVNNKTHIIYGGVDIEKFIPHVPSSSAFLFYAGVIRDHKGQLDLVKAFIKLADKFPFLELKLAGGIIQQKYLEKLIRVIPFNLKKRIHILGAINQNELVKLYKECTIFVSCSSHELFGLAIAEAMACGKPVVAANVGSVPEIINHNKNGLLIEADLWQRGKKSGVKNINKLVESIAYILDNSKIAKKLGQQARKDVIKLFTWEKTAKRAIERYKINL